MRTIDVQPIYDNFYKLQKFPLNTITNYTYRILDKEEDIPKVTEYIDEIMGKNVNRNIFVKNKLKDNFDIFNRGGLFLAIYHNDKIVSARIVDIPTKEHNLGKYKDMTDEELEKSVQFDTIVVSPEFRGKKLQQISFFIAEYLMMEKGYKYGFTTVSPDNFYSVHNILKQDFTIFDVKKIYATKEDNSDAVLRYIAYLPLGQKKIEMIDQYCVKNTEIQWQLDVIAEGFVGTSTTNFQSVNSYYLCFSKEKYSDQSETSIKNQDLETKLLQELEEI